MILVDSFVGATLFVTSAIIMAIGAYGLTASNNLLRQLLSVEVIFNGLLLLVIPLLSGFAALAAYFGIIVISVVSVEVVVVVSILIAFLRQYRSLSSSDLEESEV
ncbi:NADH-quinone oxidoreductase subunit K [Acidilobus saccharovorans 345-15]|uniref:NADH-quinone oxidoreductase subunit K n=1 Tax=Acidilobus saccharovorans (strain DSM 16705 / JCM 18335 / VKM B-2471 / 345-15) TaxID=666510 RepID=D9Q0E5_ACIS3|nr:NADH-quinone oxidoreductase subunit K [Acidilobus saccharovorans]ADL18783.1 NADH-quinone oxidoreductase subunit K [Acidilobus saccharovorans 345-15]